MKLQEFKKVGHWPTLLAEMRRTANAKINETQSAVIAKNEVLGFDIAVNDPGPMQSRSGTSQTRGDPNAFIQA